MANNMLNIVSLSASIYPMKSVKLTSEALTFWLKKSSLTQQKLAEMSGLAQNYISQIKTGNKAAPSFNAIEKICEALGVSIPEFFACEDDSKPDLVFVEKVKAKPRAGVGGLETDNEHDGYYSFHSSFIARKGGTAKTMRIFEVAGDSMSPTLDDGDMIMVNTAETDIRTGRIYLLRIGDELMVKRLETRPGGKMLIRSDNERYEDIPVDLGDESSGVEIFGRMVWSCREY